MKQNLNTKVSQQLASIPPLQISEVHLLCNNLNDEIKQHGNSRIHKQHGSFGKDQVSPAPYLPADIFNITASYICTGKQHCKNHQKQRHKLRLQVCIYLIKDRYFFSRLCRQEYGHSHIDGFWFHCFCNVFCLLLFRFLVHRINIQFRHGCGEEYSCRHHNPYHIHTFCPDHPVQIHFYHIKHFDSLLSDSRNRFPVLHW